MSSLRQSKTYFGFYINSFLARIWAHLCPQSYISLGWIIIYISVLLCHELWDTCVVFRAWVQILLVNLFGPICRCAGHSFFMIFKRSERISTEDGTFDNLTWKSGDFKRLYVMEEEPQRLSVNFLKLDPVVDFFLIFFFFLNGSFS